ncbi:MAG TPA: DNA polymerase III subunit beta [Patescibacteria group bacterium]|nr:DNA polymerase III subunit beta [Patescibacteria group bacterium]
MKFSCTQENINRGVQIASHITSRNVHLPILHNVLIKAGENGIECISTNLEVGIRVFVRGKVEEPGSLTIPAQLFSNYISLLSAERVDVSSEETTVHIQAGNQQTKIKGEGTAEFPLIPEVEQTHPILFPAKELKEAIKQVLIAISHDHSRPELTGALCAIKDQHLVLAATDSYRLAERKIQSTNTGEVSSRSIIIPFPTLSELVRILPETDEEVKFFIGENQLLFKTAEFEMTSRIIEGSFPDYEQIIPTQNRTKAIIDREALIKSIKAASLFSKSGIHDIHMHLSPEKQIITLTAVNNQVGENTVKIEAEILGESNNIVFNYRYVIDGLSNISTDKVHLSLIDNTNPGAFRPHGDADTTQSYVYIIMPIKQ